MSLIAEKLTLLPDKPGVYLYYNEKGEIIYVGKARSLKNRVRSYFRAAAGQTAKVKALVSQIADLEYIVVDSEVEALILECNLIKEHRPRYNVDLKDDKTYPYIKITVQEEFPRLTVTRSKRPDGARYFGPYTNVGAMRETLRVLRRLFPLRTCSDTGFKNRTRPCLNAHIHRCCAPCTAEVSVEEYRKMIGEVLDFLEGRRDELLKRLKAEMEQAAGELKFEQAAELRDQLLIIDKVLEQQKIVSAGQEDEDIFAFAAGSEETCGQVFFVRGGKVTGRAHFFLTAAAELEPSQIMAEFLKRYYSQAQEVPGEILLAESPGDETEVIQKWLKTMRGKQVQIKVPRRGDKLKLVEMVRQNAALLLQEREKMARQREARGEKALLELQEALELDTLPRRIECYDISNIQGTNSVGSMVVFEDGRPKTSEYRRFKIKTVNGPNDFRSLEEIISRRFRAIPREVQELGLEASSKGKFARWPDLVIIDGGKGQLSAVRKVMRELGVDSIPTFGLAKKEELLFHEGGSAPLELPRGSAALYLLQQIRDEAHRFAITYHRQLRGKEAVKSVLDEIPGVGAARKRALLNRFGSVQRIREAPLEELAATEGISPKLAEEIQAYFRGLN